MPLEFDSGWQMELDNEPSGRWRQVRWRLPAASIRDALFGPDELGANRAGDQRDEQGTLLLSDVTVLDDHLVATTLVIHTDDTPDQIRLNVLITAENDWQPALQAQLQVGDRALSAAVIDGAATFTGLGLSELLAGLSLTLTRQSTAP